MGLARFTALAGPLVVMMCALSAPRTPPAFAAAPAPAPPPAPGPAPSGVRAESTAVHADSLAPALTAIVFDRCLPDTNLGCNPTVIPGCDSTLGALAPCGPAFVRCQLSDSSAGRVSTRTILYAASDGCGHTATCSRTITWTIDHVAPVLPRFTDTTLVHDQFRCTAALALPLRASQPDDDSVAIVYAPPPPFPIGTTRVVATAKDTCGNADRDSFTVTVTTEICGTRFYDANGNGQNDDRGEIANWPVTLVGTTPSGPVGPLTTRTGADGRYCFSNLLAGSYAVIAGRTPGTIGSAPDTVAFPRLGLEGGCPAAAELGEFCIGRGGGAPLASWAVPNAKKLMSDAGGAVPELEELSALCLRNKDGTEFKPTTEARFRSWLQSVDSTNMAYPLAVQLATLYLNVEAGLVSGNAIVVAEGCGNRGTAGSSILVNDLLAIANVELCSHGLAAVGSPDRERQLRLKVALELANTDRGFLQKTPCSAPAGAPVEYHPTQRK